MDVLGFVNLVLLLVGELLTAFRQNAAARVSEITRRLAVAALRASAEVDNAPVNWQDPEQVANYVRSLPRFEPLP
ncbi:MAG: hypothetical protein ACE5HB_09820 [Terriglobia bacterium]